MMNLHERRSLLEFQSNPDQTRDYVITLSGSMTNNSPDIRYDHNIQYVPDRTILVPESLNRYLMELNKRDGISLEEITTTILSDLQNQIVPRWVQVAIKMDIQSLDHIALHQATVEDAQPGWHNDELLNRLASA